MLLKLATCLNKFCQKLLYDVTQETTRLMPADENKKDRNAFMSTSCILCYQQSQFFIHLFIIWHQMKEHKNTTTILWINKTFCEKCLKKKLIIYVERVLVNSPMVGPADQTTNIPEKRATFTQNIFHAILTQISKNIARSCSPHLYLNPSATPPSQENTTTRAGAKV